MSTYRIVTLAYPKTYRQDHLPELVATANELRPAGWSHKESKALLTNGLRTRARFATNDGDARQVWTLGIRIALLFSSALAAGFSLLFWLELGDYRRWMVEPAVSGPIVFCEVAAVAALLLTTRWPAAVAVSAAVIVNAVALFQTTLDSQDDRFLEIAVLATAVVSVGGAWWMAFRGHPGRRQVAGTGSWILTIGSFAAFLVFQEVLVISVASQSQLLVLPALAIVVAPFDPRLAAITVSSWALSAPVIAAGVWADNDATQAATWAQSAIILALLLGAFILTQASTKRLTRT